MYKINCYLCNKLLRKASDVLNYNYVCIHNHCFLKIENDKIVRFILKFKGYKIVSCKIELTEIYKRSDGIKPIAFIDDFINIDINDFTNQALLIINRYKNLLLYV